MRGTVRKRLARIALDIIEKGGLPKGWSPKKLVKRLKINYKLLCSGRPTLQGVINIRAPKLAGGTRKARRNFLKKLKKEGAEI